MVTLQSAAEIIPCRSNESIFFGEGLDRGFIRSLRILISLFDQSFSPSTTKTHETKTGNIYGLY
jgi:hypothetical protein